MNEALDLAEPRRPSDGSLLRLIRQGDQDAAKALYERYADRLRLLVRSRCSTALARRLEVDDIVQSVFRRFFRRVNEGDYKVPPGEELWGLLLVITLNKIRSEETYHRADKRDVRLTVGADVAEWLPDNTTEDQIACTVLQLTIDEALKQLPDAVRSILELRVQGYEVADIAHQVGRSKRTVERTLQELRARLLTLLEDEPVTTAHS